MDELDCVIIHSTPAGLVAYGPFYRDEADRLVQIKGEGWRIIPLELGISDED
jgi:hypothetical protein